MKRFIRGPQLDRRRQRLPPPDTSDASKGPRLRAVGRAVRASAAEVMGNPRARSAVLRSAERVA